MPKSSERVIEQPQSAPKGAASLAIEIDGHAVSVPTREQIEQHAYELYLGRGCADGLDMQDWLQAENELLAEAEKISPRLKVAAA